MCKFWTCAQRQAFGTLRTISWTTYFGVLMDVRLIEAFFAGVRLYGRTVDFLQSDELDCGGPMAGKPGHLDVY